jgi:hypothetical protein
MIADREPRSRIMHVHSRFAFLAEKREAIPDLPRLRPRGKFSLTADNSEGFDLREGVTQRFPDRKPRGSAWSICRHLGFRPVPCLSARVYFACQALYYTGRRLRFYFFCSTQHSACLTSSAPFSTCSFSLILKRAVGSHEEAQKRTKKEHTNLNQITCRVNENSSSGFLYVFVLVPFRGHSFR